MSFFGNGSKGRIKKPLFMILYSGPGIGKSTMASTFPDPFFIDLEESTHNITVERDRPETWDAVMAGLEAIRDTEKGKLEFKTLVFDTIDEVERLLHKHIAGFKQKNHILDIGFQKGFEFAVDCWADLITLCRQIRDKHKIHFVFLAHSIGRSHEDVEQGESYQRHAIGIHKKSAAYLFGAVEMVLFAKKDVVIRVEDDKIIAKDTDRRVLCTSISAHYDAKNRIGLPPVMPMPFKNAFSVLWEAYEKAFNETPESVYSECTAYIKEIRDADKAKEMSAYIEANKGDIASLRTALSIIIKRVEEQNG